MFLLVFMPTIMFHAGYTLDAAPFIMNIGSICMTAFIGTTISAFVIGLLMWVSGLVRGRAQGGCRIGCRKWAQGAEQCLQNCHALRQAHLLKSVSLSAAC